MGTGTWHEMSCIADGAATIHLYAVPRRTSSLSTQVCLCPPSQPTASVRPPPRSLLRLSHRASCTPVPRSNFSLALSDAAHACQLPLVPTSAEQASERKGFPAQLHLPAPAVSREQGGPSRWLEQAKRKHWDSGRVAQERASAALTKVV